MHTKASKYFQAVLLFIFISCNEALVQESPCVLDQSQQLDSAERYCNLPAQTHGNELQFNIELVGFTLEQEEKMLDALERLKLAVNSIRFEELVIAHSYQGEQVYIDNNGLSNTEVYQVIMDGAETLTPELDNEIDLVVNLYYSNNSTVGYTYENSKEIWINQKFFDINSQAQIAGNILHEWTHKLGFKHDFYSTNTRNYSVPYAVGDMIELIISEM